VLLREMRALVQERHGGRLRDVCKVAATTAFRRIALERVAKELDPDFEVHLLCQSELVLV
jgi:hypothetical protein